VPDIRVEHLSKSFSGTKVLDDVSFVVKEKEFVTLLGPSGCGKTTTLLSIAGFQTPDAGRIACGEEIFLDREARVELPAERRNLGMVFQSYAIWPHMTVAQNVAFPLRIRKAGKREIQLRVAEVLDLVELGKQTDRYPHQLSGGQQQRVALARAIAYAPQILLFDEPLSNLDAQLREEMRLELKDIHREIGITAVYVTHDQAEAMSLSDRIAVMGDGQILQVGAPRERYDAPGDVRVARFLGRTNLFDATVVAKGAPVAQVRIEGSEELLWCRVPPGSVPSMRGSLCVRPEAISVRPAGQQAPGLAGHVCAAIYLGNVSQLHVALAIGKTVEVQQVTRQTWNVGDPVSVAFDPERCYFIAGAQDARSVS
jgi:iron(III) transport system ATP-binding protein